MSRRNLRRSSAWSSTGTLSWARATLRSLTRLYSIERDTGLLMPYNVIVYKENSKTYVVSVRPSITMNIMKNPALADTAAEVERKLKKAVDIISCPVLRYLMAIDFSWWYNLLLKRRHSWN
jgi:hypothetical protein